MVKVEYIKPWHPLNIWDVREVSENKAKFLVNAGMVKIISWESVLKDKKVSKQAKDKKNTKKQEKSLLWGVKSMLGFGNKKNKQITGSNNK